MEPQKKTPGRERPASQVPREDLASVDMAAEDRGEAVGEVGAPDHVVLVGEGEVGGSHRRPFDGVMEAEQASVGGNVPPPGLVQKLAEA